MPDNDVSQELVAALAGRFRHRPAEPEPSELEKATDDYLSRQKWGPDYPWYLPEHLVGDKLYRYQGVLLHGGLAGLAAAFGQPIPAWGNLAYAAGSIASGRTARSHIRDSPMPSDDP